MADVIDLDKLVPEPKKIKLNGKIMDLYPGKLKTIIKLQRDFTALQQGDGEKLEAVINTLAEILPDIKKEEVDIPLPVLRALVQLAYETSMPSDNANTAEAKMTPSTEKKTELNEQ